MKLIIDIPEETYQRIKEYYEKNDIVEATYSYIVHGIPYEEQFINKPCISQGVCQEDKIKVLENIKAEIQATMDMYKGCEYIGDKARRDELWHVLEIIDRYIGEQA